MPFIPPLSRERVEALTAKFRPVPKPIVVPLTSEERRDNQDERVKKWKLEHPEQVKAAKLKHKQKEQQ